MCYTAELGIESGDAATVLLLLLLEGHTEVPHNGRGLVMVVTFTCACMHADALNALMHGCKLCKCMVSLYKRYIMGVGISEV